ncbi:MAG: hypothetical protein PHV42_01700 [Candidatus Pacebacteria bacterium]|nr:hypothetical protein [Candidatus Paceibacterota bacterium]
MANIHFLVGGSGKMAELALRTLCERGSASKFGADTPLPSFDSIVAINFGSQATFDKLLAFCEEHGIPLIQASTGQKLPEVVKTAVIVAPNLALPIVALMGVLPAIREALEPFGMEFGVVEGHHPDKTGVPGTAQAMAAAWKSLVFSVREKFTQLVMGVPQEAMAGHGHHFLFALGGGVEICISTKVNGRVPYIESLPWLGKKILDSHLPCGFRTIQELLGS